MASASGRSDALAIGLSLGAAATSAYVLWKTTQEPKRAPTDKKLEKKLKQQARSRKIESLIMERGQAGTKDYRVHVLAKGEEDMTVAELSLWHDVPLVAEGGQCPPIPHNRVYHEWMDPMDAARQRDMNAARQRAMDEWLILHCIS